MWPSDKLPACVAPDKDQARLETAQGLTNDDGEGGGGGGRR